MSIWLRKVLSTDKDCTESASQKVRKVLFWTRKLPFSSSEKCYFQTNICRSFLGPTPIVVDMTSIPLLFLVYYADHRDLNYKICGHGNLQCYGMCHQSSPSLILSIPPVSAVLPRPSSFRL